MIDFEIVTWPRHAIKADVCSDRCLSALHPRILTEGTPRTVQTSFIENFCSERDRCLSALYPRTLTEETH